MLKSETERMLRRCIEEAGAEFTEKQIEALVLAFMKICDRMIEEALANSGGGNSGRPRK